MTMELLGLQLEENGRKNSELHTLLLLLFSNQDGKWNNIPNTLKEN